MVARVAHNHQVAVFESCPRNIINIAVVVAMVARKAHNLETWFESNDRNNKDSAIGWITSTNFLIMTPGNHPSAFPNLSFPGMTTCTVYRLP